MSASPGGFVAMRSLAQVKDLLGNIGGLLIPENMSISKAHEAFNEDGSFVQERNQQGIQKLGAPLVNMLNKLNH